MSEVEAKADLWPLWDQPATQGDVIKALIRTRSCVVNTWVALSALRRGDKAKFDEAVDQLNQSDEILNQLIESIAGGIGKDD